MRYIIVGAGAVGGTIGARLHEGGHEVVLVARGAQLAALREDGLRFGTPEGLRTLRVPVADGPGGVALREDDALVLAVKTQDSAAALAAWAPRPVAGGGTAGERLPLLCAQNGVENERLALRLFRQVLAVCVWLPSGFVEPGLVTAAGTPVSGVLRIGGYPAGDGGATAAAVAADLAASAFSASVDAATMDWKHTKLLGNLGNALDAVAGPVEGDPLDGLRHRAMAEGAAVLAAAGIAHHDPQEQAALAGKAMTMGPVPGVGRSGSSSWQSLARGTGSIEADHLNGEIVLLGRLHGVPTPLNEALQRLANAFARAGRAPGSLTPAERRALLDL
ncbi:ketopantoate reductase family protein [Kitasatospora sp. A2-31]|uniref:ketopantoate reductase family protein n=1 Tax=Kitasatospora sp. A2-31 TaxID=2916414 RepID=UPI001EE7A43C|nr:2-dehydropantoate 2-reductase N-terminal domain-containing protein [Kitasatospora sp. A2-31]MCG6492774.1 ketopantoate reductase family protein [Kitasatospora sp. A2-31]